MTIKPITADDNSWVTSALTNLWGSMQMVSRGKLVSLHGLPGFIAEEDGRKVGLVTYRIEEKECEIVSINALTPGKGIGTALIEKVEEIAKEKRCTKITSKIYEATKAFFLNKGFTSDEIELHKSI